MLFRLVSRRSYNKVLIYIIIEYAKLKNIKGKIASDLTQYNSMRLSVMGKTAVN